jgi:PadR family transcriptional regulator, regulatory protein AphA
VEPLSLTPTSYLVLGLVAHMGPVTSYEMKQRVAISIGYFWHFPHSQLYAEPSRLHAAGLLDEDAEEGGRRRKRYTITPAGRKALEGWLSEPTSEHTEVRDLALLKLFFGAMASSGDRRRLALTQRAAHQAREAEYEALRASVVGVATEWELKTLEVGLRFEKVMTKFWEEIAEE